MASVSRYEFLRGAGVLGATALVPLTFGFGQQANAEGAEDASSVPAAVEVAVHETDVLIVGGGVAGCNAARAALGKGVNVTILDKGPWGHSGTSGINWGHDATTAQAVGSGEAMTMGTVLGEELVGHQALMAAAGNMHVKYRGNLAHEQMGMIFDRHPDPLFASPACKHGYFNRHLAQLIKRMGANIHDWMYVLNILQAEDSSVAGVVAINMRDGSAHVFKAKATVLATGSYAYVAGWNGIGARSIAGPENTGDGFRMLLEAGVPMRDMEYLPTDFVQWTPMATRQGMGAMGASIVNATRIYDKDGNPIIDEKYAQMMANGTLNNPDLMGIVLAAIYDGKGGPHGGVFVDTTELANDDRYYRHAPETMASLGLELPTMVELVPEQWESAASPWNIEPATCAVPEIPGLFYAGGMTAAWFGGVFYGASGTGLLAGEGSADYVSGKTAPGQVDWDKVSQILSDAYGLLYAQPEDGVRSIDVWHQIQNCYWDHVGPFKTEEGLNEGIAQFDRIEAEVMPKMYVASKSRIMNNDWQKALENRSLLMCAKATAHAALQRKESRGAHCRVDYPYMDNENYIVNTKVQFVDGQWNAELGPVVDTLVSADEMRAMVEEKGGMVGFPIETA